ncbi:hypothetical protein IJH23_03045 [Candidatus Saccharibacteria bacterium]|nr:hypothetical protein [Candidatus Saccharibacteria bacterium]
MDSYLTDRETLGKFVDELLAKKFPGRDSAELTDLREENIKQLDDEIGDAIFGALSREQLEEFNAILDSGEENQDVFRNFFSNAGLDLESKISETLKSFSMRFLEGKGVENA